MRLEKVLGKLSLMFQILSGQSSSRRTRGYRWLYVGSHDQRDRVSSPTIFRIAIFMLHKVDLHVVGLCAMVVETFNGLSHVRDLEVVPEVVEADAHQFMWCKFLWAKESESPPPCNSRWRSHSPSISFRSVSDANPS